MRRPPPGRPGPTDPLLSDPLLSAPPRPDWATSPAGVRAAVDPCLGSPVVRAVTARGGFSPGVGSRLLTADGLWVFARDGGVARALSPSSAARRMGSTYSASRAIVPTARTMSKPWLVSLSNARREFRRW